MQRALTALFLAVVVTIAGGIHVAIGATHPVPLEARSHPREAAVPVIADPARNSLQSELPATPRSIEPISPPTPPTKPSPEKLATPQPRVSVSEQGPGKPTAVIDKPILRTPALIPILMYHNVRPIDFKSTNAFVSSLTLPPTQLDQQLTYLAERGFRGVTLREVAEYLQGRRDLPPRPVVLTFDDGFENNRTYAYPVLVARGFVGTFFIVAGLVGKPEYMTWKQVSELATGGMEIGSHTVTHPDLQGSTPAARETELTVSKQMLEQKLGMSVTALSYPSGSFNPEVVVAAERAGYRVAVTTRYSSWLDGNHPMELPRVRIQGTDDLSVFRWRIEQNFQPVAPRPK